MSGPRRVALPVLDREIEARARAIQETEPYWPCKEGCDLCCRSLPHLPTISATEWERLGPAIDALPREVQGDIRRRIDEASASEASASEASACDADASAAPAGARPRVTCPLLDLERGACRVYEARPIACRTYGFFTERDAGLHCALVTDAIAEHDAAERIIWGNGERIADAMRAHGEVASLASFMGRDGAPIE